MNKKSNLYYITAKNAKFSTFLRAISAVGLAETLKDGGPFTLFAPTNEAFDKLPDNIMDELLKPRNKERLMNVLTYHVVPGKLVTAEVKDADAAKTLHGQSLTLHAKGSTLQVNNAKVMTPAIDASNGVILPVDTVLVPHLTAPAR